MLVCERAILRDKVKDKSTENKKQILKFEKNDEKGKDRMKERASGQRQYPRNKEKENWLCFRVFGIKEKEPSVLARF